MRHDWFQQSHVHVPEHDHGGCLGELLSSSAVLISPHPCLSQCPMSEELRSVFLNHDDLDDHSSFMAMGRHSRSLPKPVLAAADDPRVVCQGPEDDTDDDSDSSADDDADWRCSIIFSVHGAPAECNLNFVNLQLRHHQVARALEFPNRAL